MTSLEFKNKILNAYGAMVAIAYRILGNRDESKDIVQDVIKDLWEKHEVINISGDPSTYALKCVQNRCIDLKRQTNRLVDMEEIGQDISDNTNDDPDYIYKVSALYEAISQLKEPAKTVIKLNLEGKSSSDIAEKLHLSHDNIRKILSRTRNKLRILIDKQGKL